MSICILSNEYIYKLLNNKKYDYNIISNLINTLAVFTTDKMIESHKELLGYYYNLVAKFNYKKYIYRKWISI
jgi:hypothetical protein